MFGAAPAAASASASETDDDDHHTDDAAAAAAVTARPTQQRSVFARAKRCFFPRLRSRRGGWSDPDARDARAASCGAAWFAVSAQAAALAVLALWPVSPVSLGLVPADAWGLGAEERPRGSDTGVASGWALLLGLQALHNAAHWNAWHTPPGFVPLAPSGSAGGDNAPTAADAPVDEDGVPLHWCGACGVWQPLRAKHCGKCGRCVLRYDHHCFWIGGCCGAQNHRAFFVLLVAALAFTGHAAWLLAACVDVRLGRSVGWNALRNGPPLVLALTAGLTATFVGSLVFLHSFLVLSGTTTWELMAGARISYLRHHRRRRGAFGPFDRGTVRNVVGFFGVADAARAVWRFERPEAVGWNVLDNGAWSCC